LENDRKSVDIPYCLHYISATIIVTPCPCLEGPQTTSHFTVIVDIPLPTITFRYRELDLDHPIIEQGVKQ